MRKRDILFFLIVIFFAVIIFAAGIISGQAITGDTVLTGKAAAQVFGMNISVIGPAQIVILNPKNQTYLINESFLLNYTKSGAQSVWYNLDNGENTTITSVSYAYFNTSQGAHLLQVFANNSYGNVSSVNVSFFINSTRFRILYEEYNNSYKGSSNDFARYGYESMQNLTGVILEHSSFGKIGFNNLINLTDDLDSSDNILDLDSNTNVSFNRIELNETALPNFNKSATLWLYGLSFTSPRILKDGSVCPLTVCTNESYSGGTLKFNVTGFSVYSAEETPVTSVTPPPSGGSGGGRETKGFSVDKENIKISVKEGETGTEQITIKNTGSQKITIKITAPQFEDFLKISESSFELEPGKSKIILLDFLARENTIPDLYIGKINIEGEGIKKEILTALEVESKKPLFDVKIEIPKEFLIIEPGKDLLAAVTLFSMGKYGKVDVNVEYIIKNTDNKIIASEHETIAVETQASFIKRFKMPENAEKGDYFFYVKATYAGETSSASARFTIGKEIGSTGKNVLITAIIFIILILAIILFEMKKLKNLLKSNVSLDESILAKQGLIKVKGGGIK